MEMEKYRDEIEAIKIAAGSMHYTQISVKDTMIKAVQWLLNYYEYTGEEPYLNTALIHIQAFLEMGFSYDYAETLFNAVLEAMSLNRHEIFPKRFYKAEEIKLTKTQVRKIIRRWSPSKYHTKPINEVVDDIIDKVKNRKAGIYYYHSNNNPKAPDIDSVYELVINSKECFFRDIEQKKYYTFSD